jgi:hypothetical protein
LPVALGHGRRLGRLSPAIPVVPIPTAADAGSLPDVAGRYTLTLTASGTCSAQLPAKQRVRVFDAKIKQTDHLISAEISDASGPVHRAGLALGFVEAGGTVDLKIAIDNDLDLAFYEVSGRLTGAASPTRLTGTLNGKIRYTTASSRTFCEASDHSVVLARK